MNLTAIFCYYVLVPYFATIVSPPRQAITCNAVSLKWLKSECFRHHHQTEDKKPEKKKRVTRPSHSQPFIFQQKVDHYHFTNTGNWKQKYLMCHDYYHGNGIIFLWIGTAEEITTSKMLTGRWFEYCVKLNAMCVGIVQRGYGNILPNGDFKDENLKYLTTEQALADFAWFISNFRDQKRIPANLLPKKLKWVTYGKSRQGTLAVLMRMKYPHLVYSTLAISAPLLAKEDFNEFFTLIERDMLNEEPDLKKKIDNGYKEIIKHVKNENYESIGNLFNFCDKNLLKNNKDKGKNLEFMYFTLAQSVALVMRYGKDYSKDIKNEVTDIMSGTKQGYKISSPLKRFAALISKVSGTTECIPFDYYKAVSVYQRKIESGFISLDYPLSETFGERAKLYQSCNEFGHFETFENFFGTKIGLEFYTEFCEAVFGERFKNQLGTKLGVRRTNVFYGGLNIVVSRVIYVHGDKDPYRKLGIINEHRENSVTYILQGARHCHELDDLEDTPNLIKIKKDIHEQLWRWLILPGKSEFIENNNEKENNAKVKSNKIVEKTRNTGNNERTEETANYGNKEENNINNENGNHPKVHQIEITNETDNPEISKTADGTLTTGGNLNEGKANNSIITVPGQGF